MFASANQPGFSLWKIIQWEIKSKHHRASQVCEINQCPICEEKKKMTIHCHDDCYFCIALKIMILVCTWYFCNWSSLPAHLASSCFFLCHDFVLSSENLELLFKDMLQHEACPLYYHVDLDVELTDLWHGQIWSLFLFTGKTKKQIGS